MCPPSRFFSAHHLPPLLLLTFIPVALFAQPGLTIYSSDFAVVRDTVALELKEGENIVRYSGATANLDPSTVILRDPSNKVALKILEQNYRNDPVTSQSLLDRFEDQAQNVSFLVHEPQKPDRIVDGRVIRSGYVPGGQPVEPIIEVEGKLMFELPGKPLFAGLKEDNILKPQLLWKIWSPSAVQLHAELAYLTTGLGWSSSYNVVLPENSETADLVGWITIQNRSGKSFENAKLKLMAGDVNRTPTQSPLLMRVAKAAAFSNAPQEVTEKSFDNYHLYNLPRPTSLRDQETKQVEFTRAAEVPTKRIYRYDGLSGIHFPNPFPHPTDPSTPAEITKKVTSYLELQNTAASKLGIPLPAGNVRVYRKDGETLEFLGEDHIEHTPANETVRLKLGAAFDLVGERKRTNLQLDAGKRTAQESLEIRLRNRGKRPVTIEVLEHLRQGTAKITEKSHDPEALDASTLLFPLSVEAESETVLRYTVNYSW